VVLVTDGVIVILVSLTLSGCRGMLRVNVIVLLTATPVAAFIGSDDDISKVGTPQFSNTISYL
jgi:hypothetical protein